MLNAKAWPLVACVVYLCFRYLFIALDLDLWAFQEFRCLFIPLAVYMAASHLSNEVTTHNAYLKKTYDYPRTVDSFNRAMDAFVHCVYSIIFMTNPNLNTSIQCGYIHLFQALWHLLKYGGYSFAARAQTSGTMNGIDAACHMYTLLQMLFRVQNDTICCVVSAFSVFLYLFMRRLHLIW